MPAVKFCGLRRPEDANAAVDLGAAYVGVIFAGGPRRRSVEEAKTIFSDLPTSTKRVGVFAAQTAAEILAVSERLQLQVLQLHEPASIDSFSSLRSGFKGEIWLVQRIRGADVPPAATEAARVADAVLLDAHVVGMLGGTGVPLPWAAIAASTRQIRAMTKLVLAGGLRPDNVRNAIEAVGPDVVDVSSGVESSPGIKDHERMRAFRDAVSEAAVS